MAKLLNLRWGVSDDPAVLQPSLQDCLETLLSRCELLAANVIEGLLVGSEAQGPRRNPALQQPVVRTAIEALRAGQAQVCSDFRAALTRLVYEGGGRDQRTKEPLRFDDLHLLDDSTLDESIEQARAEQEVARMVDDVLPPLDALVSTLLGWRTVQPGLNPVRPEVFVQALQASLWSRLAEPAVREALVVPCAGLLGVQLRTLYREMADWLGSTGVEPAPPAAGRRGAAVADSPVSRSVAKTLLTLERLRKLLAGDFDAPSTPPEFLHTVPASLSLLQEMGQVDALVQRLEQARAERGDGTAAVHAPAAVESPRLGRQLGEQVIRLLFDNLAREGRLVAEYRRQLRVLEPAIVRLAEDDSRFFSDPRHPARELLQQMTQRSMAFCSESDPGWQQFVASIEAVVARLAAADAPEAAEFGSALAQLQEQWERHDAVALRRREEAARALVHAEQRNLLAQRLAEEFEQVLAGTEVPEFVADFLKTSWCHVVAEDKLRRLDGADDALGLRALVDELAWSVQPAPARRGRLQRLAQLIPGMVARLRVGMRSIDYPPELAERFFERLGALHASALKDGRDAASRSAAEQAREAPSEFGPSAFDDAQVWLAPQEAQESGYLEPQPDADRDRERDRQPGPAASDAAEPADAPAQPAAAQTGELPAIGAWVELQVQGNWERVQLSWASPHRTLFMFTSPRGSAHSMSRRTLERLQSGGQLRMVADRSLVDEALDQVARAALRNSIEPGDAA
ncbi:DUF1631 family protein [Ramlibacter sp. AN1015]|uniref:DUF1631 family protein n=1 Tax=Ramlibacter sp. AN1015 TaxID=3133428 RepID=UPI0030BBDF6A